MNPTATVDVRELLAVAADAARWRFASAIFAGEPGHVCLHCLTRSHEFEEAIEAAVEELRRRIAAGDQAHAQDETNADAGPAEAEAGGETAAAANAG